MKKYILLSALLTLFIPAFTQQLIVPDNYPTIQAAIDAAQNGDTVLVKPGDYYESINFTGKSIVVGSEYIHNNDIITVKQTVIHGDSSKAYPVTFHSGEDSTSKLIGFSFNKNAMDTALGLAGYILAINSSPVISYNHFTHSSWNFTGGDYAGIACINSHAVVKWNTFDTVSHHSSDFGAHIYAKNGAPKILNNTINGGYIGFVNYSAAILADTSQALISGNDIFGSNGGYVHAAGAGIMAIGGQPEISFNIVANTYFDNISGAILGIHSDMQVVNNTLYYNHYGVTLLDGGSATIKNTIVWNSLGAPFYNQNDLGNLQVTYSDIEDGWPGEGNIDAFPKFASPVNNYFYLLGNSPCIEAGDPASPLKPNGRRMDIGAELFQGILAIEEPAEEMGFKVYPNPATDNIYIKINANQNISGEISIHDITGRVMHQQHFDPINGHDPIAVNISDLPVGIYLIKISAGQNEYSEKVVKR